MKKFRVMGTTVVTVYKEVWAYDEDEAMEKAESQLSGLTAYCGNGGGDKLVGVDNYDESVDASGYIEWEDTEMLEDNPDYMECPDCHEELEEQFDDYGNRTGWFCPECTNWFDDDGNMIDPNDEDWDEE